MFVWRKVHGRLNSRLTKRGERERERERERRRRGDRGNLPRVQRVLRARVSRNSCGAGTDISQKMNHPYTNEPTHRGNSGTIVRQ